MIEPNRDPEQGLVRAIGPLALGANTVNLTIGAGIFALPAVVAATLGPAAVIAYLVCGALIMLVLLCYVELGTRITRSGGTVAYIEEAFGPLAGFLAWALYAVGFCAAAVAAIVHVMFDALATAVPVLSGSGPARSAAIVLFFGGLAVFNIRGVQAGTRLSMVTTTAKLIPLLLLIIVGAFNMQPANLAWTGWPPLSSFGSAALVLFFAFSSAEAALSPSGEIRDPVRTIPRGLLWGATVVVLIYLAIHIVAQGVLGAELGQGSTTPLADVSGRLMGGIGTGLIVSGTAVSIFGNLAADMIGTPRAFLAAAESGGDLCFVIGKDSGDGVLQAFAVGHRDALISTVTGDGVGAARLQRRRGDVEAPAPDLDLVGADLVDHLLLVEAGEPAVVALVQVPVLADRQPQPPHFVQDQVQRADGAGLDAGEAAVEVIALVGKQTPCRARLGDPFLA